MLCWLLQAAAYVELNSVKAGMVEQAWDYRWNSVHAHLSGRDDAGIVVTEPLLELVGDWKNYLIEAQSHRVEELASHERTGRPLGNDHFIDMAENLLGRDFKKMKPGPKPKNNR